MVPPCYGMVFVCGDYGIIAYIFGKSNQPSKYHGRGVFFGGEPSHCRHWSLMVVADGMEPNAFARQKMLLLLWYDTVRYIWCGIWYANRGLSECCWYCSNYFVAIPRMQYVA